MTSRERNVAGTRRVPSASVQSRRGRHTACACYVADSERFTEDAT
jgi:hypothetical protein